jgi:hypothetical protein
MSPRQSHHQQLLAKLREALREGASSSARIGVITGAGSYYSRSIRHVLCSVAPHVSKRQRHQQLHHTRPASCRSQQVCGCLCDQCDSLTHDWSVAGEKPCGRVYRLSAATGSCRQWFACLWCV